MAKEQIGLTTPMPERVVKQPKARKTAVAAAAKMAALQAAPDALTIDPVGGPSMNDLVRQGADANERKRIQAEGTSFIDTARALVMHQGILGAGLRRLARDSYTPEEGFLVTEEDLAGYNADDQSFLLEAQSREQLRQFKWEIATEREDMEIAGRNGTAFMMAASIFAGLPEGVVTGLGAAKAMQLVGMGSRAAALAGRTGKALALSAVENVGGNLVTTAIEDAVGGRVSAFDYAAAAGIGLVAAGIGVPGISREAHTGIQNRMVEESVARQRVLAERAIANLGEDATPHQIKMEVERLESEALRQDTRAHTSALPEDRRFMPNVEKLIDEDAPAPGTVTDAAGKGDVSLPAEKWDEYANLGAGVHVRPGETLPVSLNPAKAAITSLAAKFLPGKTVVLRALTADIQANGVHRVYEGSNTHVIYLSDKIPPTEAVNTGAHEIGHAIEYAYLGRATPEQRAGVATAFGRFMTALKSGEGEVAAGLRQRIDMRTPGSELPKWDDSYIASHAEFFAEQFAKYVQADAAGANKLSLPKWIAETLKDMVKSLLELFSLAKKDAYLNPEVEMADFFDQILAGKVETGGAVTTRNGPASPVTVGATGNSGTVTQSKAPDVSFLQDPVAKQFGIDLMPVSTPAERAEAKAVLAMYKRAVDPAAPWNNIKPEAIASMTSNSLFDAGSTSLTMLKSENPLVRMAAAELLESPTGAAGRRSTAAIAKFMYERQFSGNVINALQDHYKVWRNANGGNVAKDYIGGEHWARFNRLVAEEIEAVRAGDTTDSAPAVKEAAKVLEAGYERMRQAQVENQTVGWAALPESSAGYMPHRMSSAAVRNASNAQLRAFHSVLVDQFVNLSGFDISFSDKLATKYIDRVKSRALGAYDSPGHIHQTGASDIIREALDTMGLTRAEVDALMGRYAKGGPGYTKKRLNLNLRQEFDDGAGGTFTLMDLFETDQLTLFRSQAGRVSGEVALSRHGVMGKPGLKLMRRAMELGDTGTKAQRKELEAFDQVAAEMLGEPFGNYGGKWMNRAMQATSLARLGGMGFTQFAEYINGTTTVGVARTLSAIGSFGRLRSEAAALGRGEAVSNPIIGSLEHMSEFGTDAYKMVFPFDQPGMQYQVDGAQTMHLSDRLLRGGMHAQGKLSFWRAIHGAQQRGMAEQIVHKSLGYINSGKELDTALKDLGISAELAATIKAELPQTAVFKGDKLVSFDITKMENKAAADEYIQAVHRGTSQIIQGTFIGETGKWAHDGFLRLLTQFRTFSITSVEKQWGRQRSNHGVGVALAMLMGSMSVAAPIYIARMYAQAIGRNDKEEFLDKQLAPERIARATLNYVAMAGLAGEFLDAFSTISGIGKNTGGRNGGTTEFVGTVVAPAAGLADDVWRSVQNAKDGTDPHDLVKSLPFSKLPWLAPAINALDSK